MNAERRAEIRARLAAANPPPWVLRNDGPNLADVFTEDPDCEREWGGHIAAYVERADAELIAHAPTDLADLLADLEAAEARAAEAERRLAELTKLLDEVGPVTDWYVSLHNMVDRDSAREAAEDDPNAWRSLYAEALALRSRIEQAVGRAEPA